MKTQKRMTHNFAKGLVHCLSVHFLIEYTSQLLPVSKDEPSMSIIVAILGKSLI